MTERYRCNDCDAIVEETEILRVPNPLRNKDTLNGCPRCLSVTAFSRMCDEPGCDEFISRGTPTPSGYRFTCEEHVPKKDA